MLNFFPEATKPAFGDILKSTYIIYKKNTVLLLKINDVLLFKK